MTTKACLYLRPETIINQWPTTINWDLFLKTPGEQLVFSSLSTRSKDVSTLTGLMSSNGYVSEEDLNFVVRSFISFVYGIGLVFFLVLFLFLLKILVWSCAPPIQKGLVLTLSGIHTNCIMSALRISTIGGSAIQIIGLGSTVSLACRNRVSWKQAKRERKKEWNR